MFGPENKSKILKNKNGDTSVRTKGNLDPSYDLANENNLDAKNNKKDNKSSR